MMVSPPNEYPLWVLFAAMAVATGLLGWLSHKLAVWLTFSPLKYKGIGPLGWQGIIPKQASAIASSLTKDLIQQFGNLGQIFEYLGPEKTVTHITSTLRPQLDTLVDDVMLENHTVLWENLPISLKNRMYARMHRMLPRVVDDIIEDIGDQILWIVKIENLVVQQFQNQPEKLVELFKNCSAETHHKLGWFCAIAGSLFSWIPLLLWFQFGYWWILPAGLAGLLCLTSWVALRWLFTPMEFKLLGFKWQNNYHQQKQTILNTFTDILSGEILTSENIYQEVFNGPKSKHAHVLIKKHVNKIVDHNIIRSFVQLTTGLEGFVEIKQTLCDHIADALLEPLNDKQFNQERAKALKELFIQNSQAISDERFKSLLWPTMQAEKLPLLIISGLGGAIAGFSLLQLV